MNCGVPGWTPLRVKWHHRLLWLGQIRNQCPVDTLLQEDVRRLDVTMYDSLLMRRGQPGSDLHPNPQDLKGLKVPVRSMRDCSDSPSMYCITSSGASRSVSTLWMGTTCSCTMAAARARGKSLTSRPATCQIGNKHLDGDGAIQFRIECFEYNSHASGANQPFDFVSSQSPQHFRVRRRRQ